MCFCLAFLALSFTAVYLPTIPKLLLLLLTFLLALINGCFGKRILPVLYEAHRIKHTVTAIFAIGALALGMSFAAFDCYAAYFEKMAEKTDTVTVEITDVVYQASYGARYEAKVTASALFSASPSILLDSDDGSILPGDVLTGTVTYEAFEEDASGFDERRYALTRRLLLIATDKTLVYTEHRDGGGIFRWLRELNRSLCRTLTWETENSGLANALLLGDRSGLDDALNRDFRRLGILHMLSLSGAHLAILSTILERVLLRLKVPRQRRALITIAVVLFFMALTGFSSSLTRAGVMLILANLAFLVGEKYDYQTDLTLACAVIVACNPYAAMDWGLHLSFAAAQSCFISAALSPRLVSRLTLKGGDARNGKCRRWLRRLCNRLIRAVSSMVLLNVIITVNMLPLMWLYFGELSLISLPANLIYMPLITVLMYITLAFFLLSPLGVFSAPLASAISWLTVIIGESAEALSSVSGVVIPLNHWFAPIFLMPILLLTALSLPCGKAGLRRIMCINLSLFLCFLLAWGLADAVERNRTYTEYITEGKNDGILLKSEGKLLVCEISSGSGTFANVLAAHCADLRAAEIEAYILTHYHNLQIRALDKLTDKHIVQSLVLPTPVSERDAEVYEALVAMAAEKRIDVILTDRMEEYALMFGDAEVVTYPYTLLSRSTHPVISVGIRCGDTALQYLGGSFNEGDAAIAEDAAAAEYLIFGGHSPVYKKVFDLAGLAEAKTVYISDDVMEALAKLSAETEVSRSAVLVPEAVIRLG